MVIRRLQDLLYYGSDVWTVGRKEGNRITTNEMRFRRSTPGYSR
jgi:hypothetical protein